MCAVKRMKIEDRKNEIKQSAMKVILAKGIARATMEEIIAGTTLSKGGVYHHYGSIIEIFKDIMMDGIDYRMRIIEDEIIQPDQDSDLSFVAHIMVDKVLDENPYMPLYVEFLIAIKRNPELGELMQELQEATRQSFLKLFKQSPDWLLDKAKFQLLADYLNALIIAADVLKARETFKHNRANLERAMLCIISHEKGDQL